LLGKEVMLDGLMVRKEQVVWGTIPMVTAIKARTRAALEQLCWIRGYARRTMRGQVIVSYSIG
jgi:hypothetical protein